MLLLATFRDTEAEVPSELAETLADLRRVDDAVRLSLGGLSESDVKEFVRRAGSDGVHLSRARAGAVDARPHRGKRLSPVRAVAHPARSRGARGA